MNDQYERLFEIFCVPPNRIRVPVHLEDDPQKAYALYAFEEGFKLAARLSASVIVQDDFDPLV